MALQGACTRVSPAKGGADGGRAMSGRQTQQEAPRAEGLHADSPEAQFMKDLPEVTPSSPCFPIDATGHGHGVGELLDRASDRFDQGDHATALRCAEEAARIAPTSIEAHHDRAAALLRLGRTDEARAALERTLALDPDDTETLAAAADVFINRLPPGADVTETGLELARRGSRLLSRRRRATQDRGLVARLALLEAQALNDLGSSRDALGRAEAALAAAAEPALPRGAGDGLRTDAEYERSLALFELCRFEESGKALSHLLAKRPDHAHAHQQLGLVLERNGDDKAAERHFEEARRLAPEEFRAPLVVPAGDFQKAVDDAVRALPQELRKELEGVPIEVAELPSEVDLTLEDPPLSPTILGLYRGLPLHQHAQPGAREEPRSIALYRKNLTRVTASLTELRREVRKTLLHEIGHLHGEDDGALKARGLE